MFLNPIGSPSPAFNPYYSNKKKKRRLDAEDEKMGDKPAIKRRKGEMSYEARWGEIYRMGSELAPWIQDYGVPVDNYRSSVVGKCVELPPVGKLPKGVSRVVVVEGLKADFQCPTRMGYNRRTMNGMKLFFVDEKNYDCVCGLELSHLCKNRCCINWQHVICETREENLSREWCVVEGGRCEHWPRCLLTGERYRKLKRNRNDKNKKTCVGVRKWVRPFAVFPREYFRKNF